LQIICTPWEASGIFIDLTVAVGETIFESLELSVPPLLDNKESSSVAFLCVLPATRSATTNFYQPIKISSGSISEKQSRIGGSVGFVGMLIL
jgi:hypothetical protein